MNSRKSWVLRVRDSVYKQISKFPAQDQRKILEAIELLPVNLYFGDIEKMKDEKNNWRKRIGSYRLFYEIKQTEKVIYVFWVERRTTKTYWYFGICGQTQNPLEYNLNNLFI